MTTGLTVQVLEAMEARARARLPEPDLETCSWCGGPAAVFVDDVPRTEVLTAKFICPCCSSPRGCAHRFPKCLMCGLSTAPTGTFVTGGPFVRCEGLESHPVGMTPLPSYAQSEANR